MKGAPPLERILFPPPWEGRCEVRPSEGDVPPALRGTYYLNGPANLQPHGFTYRHWLDGDGLLRSLRFGDGRVEHLSRFVASRKLREETAAGRPVFRAFGTAFPGDRLRRSMALESPVNVSIYPFAGRLLAFGEQCLPWEIEANDLSTLGECNFGGVLAEISPFSAHPKVDAGRNRLCNFGLKFGLGGSKVAYWEFDAQCQLVFAGEFPVARPYAVHDFALTERYAAFYLSPYLLDIAPFLRRGRSLYESLAWQPELGNELLVAERNEGGASWQIPLGRRGYCLHGINAFDDGEVLTLDVIETAEPLYPQYEPLPALFATVKPSSFVRLRIDLRRRAVLEAVEMKSEYHLDFPAVRPELHGSPYRELWALAMPADPPGESKYYDRLVRFDWEERRLQDEYRPGPGIYLAGEPCLTGGVESFVICPRWHAVENRSDYVILRPGDLAAGPVAVLPLAAPSPLAFHASFHPDV